MASWDDIHRERQSLGYPLIFTPGRIRSSMDIFEVMMIVATVAFLVLALTLSAFLIWLMLNPQVF